MKILHVAETIWGGCGTYLNEIVPLQIAQLGHDQVRCLVPAQHVAHLSGIPKDLVQCFERPSRKAGLQHLATATSGMVRTWRPDIIHAHSTFAGAVVRLLSCVRPFPPIVYCPHGWGFDVAQSRASGAIMRLAERLLSHRAGRIVAISEAERLAGERAGIPAHKLVLVPNGISTIGPSERAAWSDARLKLLFVGRLDRQKGVDILLEAVKTLEKSVSVRIVGEQVVSEGDGLAASTRLPHVAFLGWQDRVGVAAQLNACDVVVVPSRWEGFGLVAVEAMRAGKPVIASSVGGLREVIVPGCTGTLVAPEDPAALGEAISAMCTGKLVQMGRAGHARFLERFTSDLTSERLMQVYIDVLGGHKVPLVLPTSPAARGTRG